MEHVRFSEDEMETLTPHVLRFVLHASKNQAVYSELDNVEQTSTIDLDEIGDTFKAPFAFVSHGLSFAGLATPEQAECAWKRDCPRLDAALRDTKGGGAAAPACDHRGICACCDRLPRRPFRACHHVIRNVDQCCVCASSSR